MLKDVRGACVRDCGPRSSTQRGSLLVSLKRSALPHCARPELFIRLTRFFLITRTWPALEHTAPFRPCLFETHAMLPLVASSGPCSGRAGRGIACREMDSRNNCCTCNAQTTARECERKYTGGGHICSRTWQHFVLEQVCASSHEAIYSTASLEPSFSWGVSDTRSNALCCPCLRACVPSSRARARSSKPSPPRGARSERESVPRSPHAEERRVWKRSDRR